MLNNITNTCVNKTVSSDEVEFVVDMWLKATLPCNKDEPDPQYRQVQINYPSLVLCTIH